MSASPRFAAVVVLLLSCLTGCVAFAPRQTAAWPTALAVAPPHAVRVDPRPLSAFLSRVAQERLRVHHVFLARDGRTVLDAAVAPAQPGEVHSLDEATGAVVGLVYAAALQQGAVPPLETLVLDALDEPARPDDIAWRGVTVGDLLDMRTGLSLRQEPEAPAGCVLPHMSDWLATALAAHGDTIPGVEWHAFPWATQLLAEVIIRNTDLSLPQAANAFLFAPLGIEDATWRTGTNTTDAIAGLSLSARSLARIGAAIQNEGVYNSMRVWPADWFAAADPENPYIETHPYTRHWHVFPDGTLAAVGRGGQRWIVDRARGAVAVVFAGEDADGEAVIDAAWPQHFVPALGESVLPEDRMTEEDLRRRSRALQAPHRVTDASPRPRAAHRRHRVWYRLSGNPVEALRVSFDVLSPVGAVVVDLLHTRTSIRAGFAGVLEATEHPSAVFPDGVAATATWTDADTLRLEIDTISHIERWQVDVRFGENDVEIDATPTLLRSVRDPAGCHFYGTR